FDKELANLYVSNLMAKAILNARPDFASRPAEVKLLVQKQFPKVADVSIDEMIAKIMQAVGKRDKLPCTIIILDEVQQYIGEDVRAAASKWPCPVAWGGSILYNDPMASGYRAEIQGGATGVTPGDGLIPAPLRGPPGSARRADPEASADQHRLHD